MMAALELEAPILTLPESQLALAALAACVLASVKLSRRSDGYFGGLGRRTLQTIGRRVG